MLGWVVTGATWAGVSLRARRLDRPLAAAGAASVAAALANPYGTAGLLFPLGLLSRFDPANVFARHVGEFQPLWQIDWILEDYLLVAFALALVAALAATFRSRRLEELLLPLPFAALALAGVRNVPLFVIVSAPILARALTDCAGGARRPGRGAAGPALFCAVAGGLGLRLVTGAFYLLPDGNVSFRTGVGLDRGARPVAACEYLLDRGLGGRILNSSNIGGWVGWALERPVYLDMRLEVIGEDLYREEVESWGPGGLDPLLAKYDPRLVMADHGAGLGGWSAQLRGRADWRLVYVDEVVAVHARGDGAPEIPAVDVDALPAAWGLAPLSDGAVERSCAGRCPRARGGGSRGSGAAPAPPAPFAALARFCAARGAGAAAERFFIEALRTAPLRDHEALFELGTLFAAAGRHDSARLAFDRLLQLSPRHQRGWNERGVAAAALGDIGAAIRDFSRAVEVGPPSALVHFNRALARQAAGDLVGARDDYSRALELDPGNPPALRGLEGLRPGPP